MLIDVAHFTPWRGLAGGVMIGVAAVLMMALQGRIAGVSGIAGGLLRPLKGDVGWRLAFILGLILGAAIFGAVLAPLLDGTRILIDIGASPVLLVIGGLLVGFGTRLGRGCTSGHGVCGLARFSRRSMVAVTVFMVSGFLTVFIVRHVVGGS
ncbi:MAG: YeeE/YedE family protein [Alphaproteobacteria bacterium]